MVKKLITLSLLCIAGTACTDHLDVSPRNALSEDTYWKTGEDAKLALVGIYDLWGGQGNGEDGFAYSFFHFLADSWSDDAFNQFGGWYETFAQGNIAPANGELAARYSEFYQVIRRCNVFLANVERAEMDDNLKDVMIGEVRFVRAYQYYILYYHWGEVQLVTSPLSPGNLNVPRSAAGGTYQLIIEDLDFAIGILPETQTEEGRIDKGAALGLKSRVTLYQASVLTNQSNDVALWQEAASAAQEVINLGKYDLFQTPGGDGYSQLFDTEYENNIEVIIDRENDALPNHGNQMVRILSSKTGTVFLVPSQNLVDSYEAYDPITDQLIAPDAGDPFLNRDPRMAYTMEDEPRSVTDYGIIKFETDEFDPGNSNNSGVDSPVNHILMRYAEVLLNYAEAKIEANDIDATVLDAINQVRARAYGVDISDVGNYPEITTTSQSELRDIVRNERRVELALEGLRWYDTRRWQIAETVRNEPIRGRTKGTIIDRTFDASRDYYWPIPQREIDLIGSNILDQNPNYN